MPKKVHTRIFGERGHNACIESFEHLSKDLEQKVLSLAIQDQVNVKSMFLMQEGLHFCPSFRVDFL